MLFQEHGYQIACRADRDSNNDLYCGAGLISQCPQVAGHYVIGLGAILARGFENDVRRQRIG